MSRLSTGTAARRLLVASWVALAVFCVGCTATPEPHPMIVQAPTSASAIAASPLQLMVTLQPADLDALDRNVADLASTYGVQPMAAWDMESLGVRCVVFRVSSERAPAFVVQQLRNDPRVGLVQEIQTFETLAGGGPGRAVPSAESVAPSGSSAESASGPDEDPYLHLQYGAAALGLREAHHLATGKGVDVAVIDTGIDIDHPDLGERVVFARSFVARRGQRFTQDVHGTAVAGVLAANGRNGEGILGVAPGARLSALKACWPKRDGGQEAVCNSYTLAQALDFAIKSRVRVINLSLSGPEDQVLAALVRQAIDDGVVVVAARDARENGGFPASIEGVLAVDEAAPAGAHVAERTSPANAAVTAPGVDVLTTVPAASYDFLSGSSLAAAHVSGVAALMLEVRPELTAGEIAQVLAESSVRGGGGHVSESAATVHACAALQRLVGGEDACVPGVASTASTDEGDSP